MATNTYLEDLDKAAADPKYRCPLDGEGRSRLLASELQYLTKVAESTVISFICRHRDCLYFGDNATWLKHEDKHWFRCPVCARQYTPWKSGDNLIPAQKVFATWKPDSPVGSDAEMEKVAFLCTWPPSAEEHFFNRLCEALRRPVV